MTDPILNFSKGEIAPALYGRIDASQYSAGVKRARNVIIQREGGLHSRPGTRIVGKAPQGVERRMFPFQFSIDQSYVLAAEGSDMRLLSGGGFVLEDNLAISAMSKTNPMGLTVTFHQYEVGDTLYFSGNEGVPELYNRFGTVVEVIDADNITIDIDATEFGDLTASAGEVRASAPPPPPPPPPPPSPPPPSPPPPSTGGGGGEFESGGNRSEPNVVLE